MKQAIVKQGLNVYIVDSPIPEPNADQIVIKVIASGVNPKDWKLADLFGLSMVPGDDVAGVIHQVGSNVTEFKRGDRVAAFHGPGEPHGTFAEYTVVQANTTFRLPDKISFEEASTIPLAAFTAASGLYLHLRLPTPWLPSPETAERTPLVIYGASSAVGAFAIQLARHSNVHPLICVAGKSQSFVETLIDRSKGDTIIDYRDGDLAANIENALQGRKLLHVFEAVSASPSDEVLQRVLAPGGTMAQILHSFEKEYKIVRDDVTCTATDVRRVFTDSQDFGFVLSRYLGRALQEGWFKPHPHQVVDGGLDGVHDALLNLKDGKASAFKYVLRIGE
ncbi:Protein TOXD [Lasiodiplodia theobromae]|uniref:Protein TOXD n=1 Tax=Lasiodiplodia theobromae TaxID=45133 RepID=A0A5N5D7Z6_9PEZI|nr:Protein TOXD [Lasiodiplodia theobromae]